MREVITARVTSVFAFMPQADKPSGSEKMIAVIEITDHDTDVVNHFRVRCDGSRQDAGSAAVQAFAAQIATLHARLERWLRMRAADKR